MVNKSI